MKNRKSVKFDFTLFVFYLLNIEQMILSKN